MRAGTSSVLTPAGYYDERHARGWMDRWPDAKKQRVIGLLRQAGLRPGAEVLEFGCGVGVFANAAKEAEPLATVHGADISPVAIARAKELHPSVHFHLLPDGASERDSESYDLVYSHHVLEHVADVEAAIAQTASVLRRGGKALHVFPCSNRDSLEYRIAAMVKDGFERDGLFYSDDVSHVRRLKSATVIDLCREHGLMPRTAYFANQWWGGIDYLTNLYHFIILDLFNPKRGIDTRGKLRLGLLLAFILPTAFLRQGPALILRRFREGWSRGKRRWLVLALPLAAVLAPLSILLDWLLRQAAAREWKRRKTSPNGSEAYVILEKKHMTGLDEERTARGALGNVDKTIGARCVVRDVTGESEDAA